MGIAALKLKPELKMFHATMHVTRVEEWASRLKRLRKPVSYWRPALAIVVILETASTLKSSA